MLCASSPGRDSCQGDSGGPLYVQDSRLDRSIQYGITSFGFGCARRAFPGIYTKLTTYAGWIADNIQGYGGADGKEDSDYQYD